MTATRKCNFMCNLKRCQGKRGCICPKGVNLPTASYTGLNSPESTRTLPEIPKKNKVSKAKKAKKAKKANKKESTIEHKEEIPVALTTPQPEVPIETPITLPKLENNPNGNGKVILRYNHYKKEFMIANGSTDASAIDAQYFLYAVFPNSKLHLSCFGPSDFSYKSELINERPLIHENPTGVYHGLVDGETYWIHVEENEEERQAYEKRQDDYAKANAKLREEKEKSAAMTGGIVREKMESCSCIEGNPCVDKYCCKDWDRRFEVAKKHGWKGFQ
ncbi:hypothetical protein THRCLA_02578 [Thraustotheca clavata]|uniref:Uncharacterized protein n=1 Tax=Thraustotheca clavata TaxID=74557 RepID=A0A1W0A4Q3_9STRA|nr:hypothetical protein THRCLA_02578 [Thraustotheca clavata]